MEKIDHKSRGHAFLSASGAELWINCPASAFANAQYPPKDTEYTQEGTIAHEVAQVYAQAALDKSGHSDLDAQLATLRERYGEAITKEMQECAEGYAAYILEQVTGEGDTVLLEQRVDFSPWVPQGFGTADCIIIGGGRITVIDYKYGQGVAVECEGNPQMGLYALGAVNEYSYVYEFDRVEMHIYQPRINNISASVTNVAALMDWADGIVQPAADAAYNGKGEYHAGPHCRKFCDHAGRCPTLMQYCCDYVTSHGLRVAVPHLEDAQILEAVQMEPLVKMWLEKVSRAATDRILAGESIDGLKVVEGRSQRKWSDEDKVMEVLEAGVTAGEYEYRDITEPPTLKSINALEKSLGKKKVAEIVGGYITRNPGKPTLVLASDKRPAYDPGADFENLD